MPPASSSIDWQMSLTLIIVFLALIKLCVAATMLLVPFRHDLAMQQPDATAQTTDDDGGPGVSHGGDGPRPRWPITGSPTGPRQDGHGIAVRAASRGRGAHTSPPPSSPRRVRLPAPRQPARPAAR
jgi:hypothetical protein